MKAFFSIRPFDQFSKIASLSSVRALPKKCVTPDALPKQGGLRPEMSKREFEKSECPLSLGDDRSVLPSCFRLCMSGKDAGQKTKKTLMGPEFGLSSNSAS